MNTLRTLTNDNLHIRLAQLAREERRITLDILHHLRECEYRRLYAERGHGSLFDYAVKELGYAESSAQRRISAMRALRDLPELEEKVHRGELKVTQLAQVQTFLRTKKKAGKTYTQEARRELILETVGRSTRETEKLLAEKNSTYAFQEKFKPVTAELTQITFTADEDLMKKLSDVKDLFAHQLPSGATTAETIRWMAEKLLNEKTREFEQTQNAKTPKIRSQTALPAPKVRTRYIPAHVRREVWVRDQGKCTYVSKTTGRPSHSQHRLEYDHCVPFAKGGASDDPKGLRLLCRAHNLLEAERVFGRPPGRCSPA